MCCKQDMIYGVLSKIIPWTKSLSFHNDIIVQINLYSQLPSIKEIHIDKNQCPGKCAMASTSQRKRAVSKKTTICGTAPAKSGTGTMKSTTKVINGMLYQDVILCTPLNAYHMVVNEWMNNNNSRSHLVSCVMFENHELIF